MTPAAEPSDVHGPHAGVPEVHHQPHYSPDGRWWWNGDQWMPAPQPPRTPMSKAAVIGIVAGLLLAVGVAGTVVSQQKQNEADDSVDRIMCERQGGEYC